jgi:uncharacterized protein YjbJ (UPF0337 family)
MSVDYENGIISVNNLPVPVNPEDNYDSDTSVFVNPDNPFRPPRFTMWFPGEPQTKGYPDVGTEKIGENSHVEGWGNTTYADESHAEGASNKAIGRYAHVEGYLTEAGYAAHAQNYRALAWGNNSHAEGNVTLAKGEASHVAGWCAEATHDRSWVWSGQYKNPPIYNYYSKGNGTFCINPETGISGFYIGPSSLNSYLADS